MRRFVVAVALLLGVVVLAAPAAGPAWDVSGRWTSYVGVLQLTQASDGRLDGSFRMTAGCTDDYAATGRIDGSAISLELVRSNGRGDELPCAGRQTLKGTVAPGGRSLSLSLSNFAQTSPPTPFLGVAKPVGAESPAWARSYPVLVDCGVGRQLCPRAFTVTVRPPAGTLLARFTMSGTHCSDVRARISVDGGAERVSAYLPRLRSTPDFAFRVDAGSHRVRVRAEGRRGGCNHGDLRHWGGTLRLRAG